MNTQFAEEKLVQEDVGFMLYDQHLREQPNEHSLHPPHLWLQQMLPNTVQLDWPENLILSQPVFNQVHTFLGIFIEFIYHLYPWFFTFY